MGLSASADNLTNFADTVKHRQPVSFLSFHTGYDYYSSSVGDKLRYPVAADEKVSTHSGMPVGLRYAFSFTDPTIRHYYPEAYQGISVSLPNIGAFSKGGVPSAVRHIGYPVSVNLFQGAPFLHFGKNFSIGYEWNFGAAFGWKPYSDHNYVYNLTVGSRVNAYLNLSLLLNYRLDSHFSLWGGVALSHYSNGNTSWPNPGVNSIGLRVGVSYVINPRKESFPAVIPDTVRRRKLEYDIALWGAARKRVYKGGEEPVLLRGHFACAGVSFAPMVRLDRWWRVGGSLDLQWDESSNLKKNYIEGSTADDILFRRPSFGSQLSFGLSVHGELQMPIFAVNIGLGYNFVTPRENHGFYQNITLKTYLCRQLYLNVGYQLRNFYQQANLMLGLGVTI